MTEPQVVRQPADMQRIAIETRRAARTIAVVPTMGALHAGHRALIDAARPRADVLIVTIFVNPTQFAPGEDLDKYPRTFDADRAMCADAQADYIYFPPNDAMYPEPYRTWVDVEQLGERLCGASRPTHFRGVTTVVAKLFNIALPDVAVFGWKDAQQFLILSRMVRDLNFPIEMIGIDTVREPDGLALSSRNRYLSPAQRAQAPALYKALCAARARFENDGEADCAALRREIVETIENDTDARIDYVETVDRQTVQPIDRIDPGNTLIALAAFFGQTRLIDNVRL